VHLWRAQNCNKYSLAQKALQKTTFWMNLKAIFFPYYIISWKMLFLVISYLLEHFEVKYAAATKKALVVHFLKNNLCF
jgi:hypothetical protein